jgi:predicted component of type VI protein secretion system
MSHRDRKEPNDFSKKMHTEGTAGFGAGPWSDPEKIDVKARPPAMPPGNSRINAGNPPVQPDKHVPCLLGDRILTGLAILSLGMLIVGAMGAYLSNDSQGVATTLRREAIPSTGRLESPDPRFVELERRLAHINDIYGERLQTLETEMAQTVGPYEARLKQVESRLESSRGPDTTRLRNLASRLEQFDAADYEARLTMLENRREQPYAPYPADLRDMESRLEQGYASHEARLREIETRLMQIRIPYEQRLQALEQRMIYASARLDHLSAEMESLTNNNAAIIEASATLQAAPPAALPAAAAREVPTDSATPPWGQTPLVMEHAVMTAPAGHANTGTGNPVAPVAETPSHEAAPSAVSRLPKSDAQGMPMTAEPTEDTMVRPASKEVTAPVSQTVSVQAEVPQIPDQPIAPPRETRQDNPPGQTGTGDWAINLASYTSETIAARKLADFRRKGVTAEQAVATVNGKTIYRVRLAGFDTRKAAMDRAETIRQQLGLKETWITRQ